MDQSNRAAFVNKKVSGLSLSLSLVFSSLVFDDAISLDAMHFLQIISALAKQREATLQKQKEDQENLIHSIFPKQVARELIASQSEDKGIFSRSPKESLRNLASFGSSVARLHRNVTILFTDIVGFTAMSQTCQPYQVMQFLDCLFVEFDDLIEMDSQLWKVETIGDAFMVASGLNVGIEDDDNESGHLKSLS